MKKIICGVLVISMCFLLVACGINQKEAERIALDYIHEHYCSTFGDEVASVEKNGNSDYTISYNVNQDYDFWKSTGSVKLSVYKDAGEWIVDVVEENISYVFKSNDNWYYITASGNREFLIKMIEFNDNIVTLEYYGYDMGSYGGPDDYDHETITEDLKYDGDNRCFTFTFMGDWRINSSSIQYNRFEVGANYEYYQSGKFNTLKPVNPEDYWWFEKAKKQTDDYIQENTDSENSNNPVNLFELNYEQGHEDNHTWEKGPVNGEDCDGNTYTNCYEMHNSMSEHAYLIFDLDKKYSKLTGTFYWSSEHSRKYYYSEDATQTLYIYNADGSEPKLLYEVTLNCYSDAVDFSINVSGIEKLEVANYCAITRNSFADTTPCLSEFKVHK